MSSGAWETRHRGYRDPWAALAAAILYRAVRDAERGDVGARRWLLGSELARFLADALDLERSRVVTWVVALEPVALEGTAHNVR